MGGGVRRVGGGGGVQVGRFGVVRGGARAPWPAAALHNAQHIPANEPLLCPITINETQRKQQWPAVSSRTLLRAETNSSHPSLNQPLSHHNPPCYLRLVATKTAGMRKNSQTGSPSLDKAVLVQRVGVGRGQDRVNGVQVRRNRVKDYRNTPLNVKHQSQRITQQTQAGSAYAAFPL